MILPHSLTNLQTVKESKRRQLSMVINWIRRHEWLSFITTNVVSCHLRRPYLTQSRVSFGHFSDMFLGEKEKSTQKNPLLFHVTSAIALHATREHCLLWPSLTCHQFAPHCSSSGEVSGGGIELTDPLKGGFWSRVHWRLLQTITCSAQQICGVDSSNKSVSTVPERKIY